MKPAMKEIAVGFRELTGFDEIPHRGRQLIATAAAALSLIAIGMGAEQGRSEAPCEVTIINPMTWISYPMCEATQALHDQLRPQ